MYTCKALLQIWTSETAYIQRDSCQILSAVCILPSWATHLLYTARGFITIVLYALYTEFCYACHKCTLILWYNLVVRVFMIRFLISCTNCNHYALMWCSFFLQGRSESWYLPTKLASNLSASLSESADWQPSEVLFFSYEICYKCFYEGSSLILTDLFCGALHINY